MGGQEWKGKPVTCGKHLQDRGLISDRTEEKTDCEYVWVCKCVCTTHLPPGRHLPQHFHHQTPHWTPEACRCWVSLELFQKGCGWEAHHSLWDVGWTTWDLYLRWWVMLYNNMHTANTNENKTKGMKVHLGFVSMSSYVKTVEKQMQIHYLCFGLRLYRAWSNLWLSCLSARPQKTPKGRMSCTKSSTLLKCKSRGNPLSPTRFRIQAPLRVLR